MWIVWEKRFELLMNVYQSIESSSSRPGERLTSRETNIFLTADSLSLRKPEKTIWEKSQFVHQTKSSMPRSWKSFRKLCTLWLIKRSLILLGWTSSKTRIQESIRKTKQKKLMEEVNQWMSLTYRLWQRVLRTDILFVRGINDWDPRDFGLRIKLKLK